MENQFEQAETKEKYLKKEIKEWSRSIILAIIIAVIIRLFLFEVFLVEGNSMYSTLHHQERVIVNKAIYYFTEPDMGDVIVFNHAPRRDFIKRVVGLEGDVVKIKDGRLFVNGEEVEEPYIENYSSPNFGPVTVKEEHFFVLGDNRSNSMDSRDPAVGLVSENMIKGKAFVVFWPPGQARFLAL